VRSWLVRGVVVAMLAGTILLVDGGAASAAPAYQLVSADDAGAPLPGATASATASADGRVVAFAQRTADGCGSSAISVRDRQARKTVSVDNGLFPSITADAGKVAYVSCTDPNVMLWSGSTPAKPVTKGEWHNSSDVIRSLVVSPGGQDVAFTVGPATGAPTALWLAHTDGSSVMKLTLPAGTLGDVALANGSVVFVADGLLYNASTTSPANPTQVVPAVPGGAITGVSVSADGKVMAVANGDGVYAVTDASRTLLTGGALDPSVSPDGSAVAVTMADTSIKIFLLADPTASATAKPIAAGGFRAPVVADRGLEVVFLADKGSAAGGSSADVQLFALGPSLSASSANFGEVGVGTTTTKAVTFTNEGTVTINPTSVGSSNAGEFAIAAAGTTCVTGHPIAVGASCVVQVALTPAAAGARASTLTVTQLDRSWDALAATANLTATAVNGELSADPTTIDFGSVTIGSSASVRSFTVTNSGTLPTTIGTLLVSGGQASEFPLAGGTCAGATLEPAAACTVLVSFKPGAIGERDASMDIGGSSGAAVSVALSGVGADPPRPALTASPTALDFDELVVGAAAAPQTVTVRNSGNVSNTPSVQLGGAEAADFLITTNGCAGRSIGAGSTCTVSIGFNPTAAGARAATLSVAGIGGSSATVRLSGTGRLNPVLAVSPAVVVSGQVVTVAGTNFPAGAVVALTWGVGGPPLAAVADETGSFSLPVVVPPGVGSGTRSLAAVAPPEAATATAAVLVQETGGFEGPVSPAFRNSPAFPP
jgi:WD40 repeat protein